MISKIFYSSICTHRKVVLSKTGRDNINKSLPSLFTFHYSYSPNPEMRELKCL